MYKKHRVSCVIIDKFMCEMKMKVILILTFLSPGVFPGQYPYYFVPGLYVVHGEERHGPAPFSISYGHQIIHPGHGHKGKENHGSFGHPGHGNYGHPGHGNYGNHGFGGHGYHNYGDYGPPSFAPGHGHHCSPPSDYGYPDYDYGISTDSPKTTTDKPTSAAPMTTQSTTTTTTTTTTTQETPTTVSTTPNYGAGQIDIRFAKPEDRRKRSTKTTDPATTEILTRYNFLGHYPHWNRPGRNFEHDSEQLPIRSSTCIQKNHDCVPADECKSSFEKHSNSRRVCRWAYDQPYVCCEKRKNDRLQNMCGRGKANRLSQAIIGGSTVTGANSYPWMTAIGEILATGETDWYCGGALVGERTVVTAAHCIGRRSADVIRIGETSLKVSEDNSGLQQISVRNTLKHPLYKPPELYNDIALLYLAEPVQFTALARPICLSQSTSVSDTPVGLLTGWGQLSFASERSTELQEVTVQVVKNSYCDRQYSITQASKRNFPRGILDTLLCAGDDEGGKDACQGDSGAPLVAEEDGDLVLIGIVSAGIGCGSKTFPGVYTRVAAFTPWILENVQ